jgi:hypothetical protein
LLNQRRQLGVLRVQSLRLLQIRQRFVETAEQEKGIAASGPSKSRIRSQGDCVSTIRQALCVISQQVIGTAARQIRIQISRVDLHRTVAIRQRLR